eukprot:403340201
MLSLSSQLRLKNLIMSLSKHEQEIEQLRLQLNRIQDFEPYCAYRIIDSINKKEIQAKDLYYFFVQEKELQAEISDAELFIKLYDGEKKGYLDIHNFNHCFLPRSDLDLREYVSLKPITDAKEKVTQKAHQDMVNIMAEIIYKEIQFHKTEFKKYVKMLLSRDDFDMESTMNSLVKQNLQTSSKAPIPGFVDIKGLQQFFKRNGFYATQDDMIAFIKRLDLNYDDAISANELARYLMLFSQPGDQLQFQINSMNGYESQKDLNLTKFYSQNQNSQLKESYYSMGKSVLSQKKSQKKPLSKKQDNLNFSSTLSKKSIKGREPLQVRDLNLESYRSGLPSNRSSTKNLNMTQKSQLNANLSQTRGLQNSESHKFLSVMQNSQNMELTQKSTMKKYQILSDYESEGNAKAIVKNAKKTRMDELLDECQRKIHELDVYLEKVKCKLALKVDFNLRDLYRFLDLEQKGFVDHHDFERICKYLNISIQNGIETDLIKSFIRSYDKDYDDKLLFTDIGRAFLSSKSQYQQLVVDRPDYYHDLSNYEEIFSLETQKLIGQVLKMQLYIEKVNNDITRQVENKDMMDEEFALAFQSINSARN